MVTRWLQASRRATCLVGGKYDAPHIVAVVGFHKKADGTKYVSYVDTAGTASGYKGTNAVQKVPLSNFWSYVDRNNVQAWG